MKLSEVSATPQRMKLSQIKAQTVTPEVVPAKKNIPAYGGMEGVRRFAVGGLPGYMSTPGSEDILPMAGQTVGSLGGYGGSVAGATAGQAGRQAIRSFRGQGFDASAIPKEAINTATWEGLTRGAGRIIPKVSNRIMNAVLNPGREVLKKNPTLGLQALEAGITGSKEAMLSKSDDLIKFYESQIDEILKNSNKRINAKNVINALDEAKASAIKGLKPEDANAIETVKQNFIKQLPSKEIVKESGFVMGPAGKQVSPQVTKLKGASVKNKIAEPSYNPEKGEYSRQIVTPRTFVENPNDIVSLHNPGKGTNARRLTTISPKETYSIRPETRGPIIKNVTSEPDMLGMDLKSGQAMKKAIYSETPDAAFNRSMQENPGSTEGRRKVASIIRKEIGGAEPNTLPLLKKETAAIQAKKALENALANSQKKVLLPKLAGMGAGAVAMSGNPIGGAGVLAGDAAFEIARSAPIVTGVAKNLMRVRRFGQPIAKTISEGVRRLYS